MSEPGPTDADLADLLDVLCDFACDADQCFHPWPDETLAPLRELTQRLRRQHVEAHERGHQLRPQSVTIGATILPEDTTINVTDARYLLPGDVIAIDAELIEIMGRPDATNLGDGDTVAVVRARCGTVAAGHAPGAVGRLLGNTRIEVEAFAARARELRAGAESFRRMRDNLNLTPAPGAYDAERAAIERTRLLDDAERLLDELEARAPGGGAGGTDADCPLAAVATPNLPPPTGHADCGCAGDPVREDRLRGRTCLYCGREQPPLTGWAGTISPRCFRCGGVVGRAGE